MREQLAGDGAATIRAQQLKKIVIVKAEHDAMRFYESDIAEHFNAFRMHLKSFARVARRLPVCNAAIASEQPDQAEY